MMIKLDDALKDAIRAMPEKEKDKLLLRLIPKNRLLVEQLEFKLIDREETVLVRRSELEEHIHNMVARQQKYFDDHPREVLYLLQQISGKINWHVSVTKDKLGEIELQLLMLVEVLEKCFPPTSNFSIWELGKFAEYVVKRIKKIIGLIEKQHEDYQLEFQLSLNKIGEVIIPHESFQIIAEELDFDISLLSEL